MRQFNAHAACLFWFSPAGASSSPKTLAPADDDGKRTLHLGEQNNTDAK
jgi:hypothetical protein